MAARVYADEKKMQKFSHLSLQLAGMCVCLSLSVCIIWDAAARWCVCVCEKKKHTHKRVCVKKKTQKIK